MAEVLPFSDITMSIETRAIHSFWSNQCCFSNLRMISSLHSYILYLPTQLPAGGETPHTHRPEAVDVLQNKLNEAEEFRKRGHTDRASEVHVLVC